MTYRVVWFKRDLRLHDHAALMHAARQGPVLCLYIVEPELWAQPDAALQHFEFVRESLTELHADLQALGGALHLRVGPAAQVLAALHQQAPFAELVSHMETGNAFTYERDLAVAAWCRSVNLSWTELPQFGVVRRLKDRNTWQRRWEAHMAAPQAVLPDLCFFANANTGTSQLTPATLQAPTGLQHNPTQRQRGGRSLALDTLHSFLNARALGYRGGISSPLSSPDACSRLSAYLAWGCISLREVVQSTRATLDALPPQAGRHRAGLVGFMSRLYWHCHFIQKLESEPEIEWRNMHPGYDGLREDGWNDAHFAALTAGRTGWPMVDACVVMLRETGWLNFRMRAMLVSVAAYPLWLDWRPVGQWLATQFLDYEPGIHWSQLQMQSGTTGINTTRVYNPIKQAQDHDPRGIFVRRWLPHMRRVPDTWLFEPWLMPPEVQRHCGLTVGVDIPQPLVDLAEATRTAKAALHARRADPDVKAGKKAVIDKHASRRVSTSTRKRRAPSTDTPPSSQLGFDF
ncbi:cryptochrome/deoxyribodipyrimidine photo-lyase family protein [Limnohabitans sp. T6-20]|uniref:cryptochrome/deoxyribodipyrimidine photo-lyase family protein n=1 Tax=Limnohabitans sp. T6-20 TaxID=1100725 RepID=UPI000D360C18|nr:FAD-binding domain-containing protein [Limnohabitans sp. T6-20]PUE08145.1 deoxyribodipyrimidine photolyase [Limnohabitans sp. T6-20]